MNRRPITTAALALTALAALAAPAAAQQNLAGATKLELTVTAKANGGVTVANGDTSSGFVTKNVMYALPCNGGIQKSSLRVKEEIAGEAAAQVYFLDKGAAHFKGMNKFVWSIEPPVATIAKLVAACSPGATPTARSIFEIKHTCTGGKEQTFFANLPFELVCPPAPAPAPAPASRAPSSLDPEVKPIEPEQPAPTPCRQNNDCPRGTFCGRDGFCRR